MVYVDKLMLTLKKRYIPITCNNRKEIMKAFLIAVVVSSLGCISNIAAQDTNPDSLYQIGSTFYSQAKYEQAAEAYQFAAKAYLQKNDSLKWAGAVLREGDALMNRGEVQKGLDLFLFVNAHQPIAADAALRAEIQQDLGRIYRELEQYEKSKEHYLKGIEFANASKDSVLIATLNNNASYPYLYTGDYEKAFFYQKKAKQLYEATGKTYELAFVLNGIFLTARRLGLNALANKYIRQSLAIAKKVGNADMLDVAYHNTGSSYYALGKPDSAIIFYQKSLDISRELKNPYDITHTLINIGGLYKESGDAENALLYYNEALDYNRTTNRPISIANNLSLIGSVAANQGDYATASVFFKEAISKLEGVSSPEKRAEVYFNMAKMELDQKNYTKADEYISVSYRMARENNMPLVKAKSHKFYGKLAAEQGDFRKSLNEYRIYYNLTSKEIFTTSVWATIYLARAYEKVNSDSAFVLAEKAFGQIDSFRTNVAGLTFRAGFFSKYAKFYNEVAEWFISQKGDTRKAFELVEAAKARVLMDELAEAEENLYQKLDESTLIHKQQMLKQIDRLHTQIRDAQNDREKEALRNDLKNLKFKYETFLNEVRGEIPEWEAFEYPEPLSAQGAMALIDAKTALIEYAFAGNQLMRFFITDNDITASVIDSLKNQSAKEYLSNDIRRFRKQIIQHKKEISSENLYSSLIPEESLLKAHITQIVVVPEGALSFLPFEALRNKNRYLIQDYNVKYLPSASIYPFIKEPHREVKYNLLAIAGSSFDDNNVRDKEVGSQKKYTSLPSTLLEVNSIATNFDNAKVLKNEDVTEAGLKSFNLGDFRFLHFATHAEIDENHPSQSGLLLSKKTEVESLFGEDGRLNSTEISGLHLNADLVTLSACNTAMGKIVTGEGLLGLQRSFLTAGASSVVVSMWSIYDRSTSEFMSDFYKKMLKYEQEEYGLWSQTLDWFGFYTYPMFDYKAKALRDAKLDMIAHPYYNDPVYWAPFILIGK